MLKYVPFVMTLMVMCIGVQASSTDWQWQFNGACFGTGSAAVDGYDSLDRSMSESGAWHCGTFHEQGADWSSDTGFYSTDVRAPLQIKPGESKTWTFYVWEDTSQNIVLELGWGYTTVNAPAFSSMNYVLTYVAPAQGVTNGPTVGKSVLLNENPQGTWRLPVYRTEDGRTGYVFSLTATVIPEPSSLLALLAGVAGIGGVAWRRKLR